jgi:hypothetical protein
MIIRLSLFLALFMGGATLAQAQYDSVLNAQGAALAAERVIACGPGTDKKDPP